MAEQLPTPRLMARRVARWALDIGVIVAAWAGAFAVRFEFMVPPDRVEQLVVTLPYVLGLKVALMAALWVHRGSWQYVGLRDVLTLLRATAAATAVLVATRFLAGAWIDPQGPWWAAWVPWGIIAADFAFTTGGLLGLRMLRRVISEASEVKTRTAPDTTRRTLVIGAGRAGAMLAKEVGSRPDLGRTLVGFLDDDPIKHGRRIHGVEVLGELEQLPDLAATHDVDDVVIAIASATGSDIRRINNLVEQAGLEAQIVPGLYEIVDGRVNMSRLRPVSIDDLLRRDPVQLDISEIRDLIAHDVVMVTGAGGSIGSELCRQLSRFNPRTVVLLERAETPLWAIHRELEALWPDITFVRALVDVQNAEVVEQVVFEHRPTVVFHAAAHKHVPMCEANPEEAVRNNVLGTRNMVDAAVKAGVPRFVLISTDKAVNPTSVMGATKRLAEQYVSKVAAEKAVVYTSVRFGNVLGSNGSVVPIFKEQIARGGPVTVTHEDMTRYFMTIPEACQLVVQAATLGEPGDLFVLEMGDPVRIMDLAEDMIRLSGLEPHTDIAIETTGIRPGEKMYEELAYASEGLEPTKNPLINKRLDDVPATSLFQGVMARVGSPQLREAVDHAFQRPATDTGPRVSG